MSDWKGNISSPVWKDGASPAPGSMDSGWWQGCVSPFLIDCFGKFGCRKDGSCGRKMGGAFAILPYGAMDIHGF
jgi:hypothetical protein